MNVLTERAKDAGEYGGKCYRTACQSQGAIYWNHSTRYYYCANCARMLNRANAGWAVPQYGHQLCTLATPAVHKQIEQGMPVYVLQGKRHGHTGGTEPRIRLLCAVDAVQAAELHESQYPTDSIDLIETLDEYQSHNFRLRSEP